MSGYSNGGFGYIPDGAARDDEGGYEIEADSVAPRMPADVVVAQALQRY
ncbi:MAG: hypothetical protein QM757_41520 [Paludibaculum sp.]